MKTRTIFLNKWAVVLAALLLVGGAFTFGVDAAYVLGKGLVYLLVAFIVLWLLGLRFNIRPQLLLGAVMSSNLLWFLYGVAVLMTWYENRWIVGAWPSDRPMWFSPAMQGKFWILRLAVSYGTLAGLWYYDGLMTAAIAFVCYYVFQKVSFRIYFTREIQMTAQRFANEHQHRGGKE